jgi:hypothetical protein
MIKIKNNFLLHRRYITLIIVLERKLLCDLIPVAATHYP